MPTQQFHDANFPSWTWLAHPYHHHHVEVKQGDQSKHQIPKNIFRREYNQSNDKKLVVFCIHSLLMANGMITVGDSARAKLLVKSLDKFVFEHNVLQRFPYHCRCIYLQIPISIIIIIVLLGWKARCSIILCIIKA